MRSLTVQDFKKYHAELRGNKLFLYQDESQPTVRALLPLIRKYYIETCYGIQRNRNVWLS